MIALRRLSNGVKQVLLISNKQKFEPALVCTSRSTSLMIYNSQTSDRLNLNDHQIMLKSSFHTTVINRDLETGLKCIGAGFSMVGAIGSGIGIGSVFGNTLSGIARNPSAKDQMFTLALMGTVFCETIALFCFIVSMIILNA